MASFHKMKWFWACCYPHCNGAIFLSTSTWSNPISFTKSAKDWQKLEGSFSGITCNAAGLLAYENNKNSQAGQIAKPEEIQT